MAPAPPSRLLIDLNAFSHNLQAVRERIPDECLLMAVVKANAYGHGAVRMAERAARDGVDMLGVAAVDEGVELREGGITLPIVVMVEAEPQSVPTAIEHNLRLTVSDLANAEKLGEQARKLNKVVAVHCKIDTGMGRQGLNLERAANDLLFLTRISHIDIEGVCTHFASADSAKDTHTPNQVRMFRQLLRDLDKEGIPYEMAHACNSAGIINQPGASFDMVRPGLMTYGVWPCPNPPESSPLRPVMRWETRVRLVRQVESGATIGYGQTYTARSRMRLVVLPVGYADGYPHALGNKAEVLIRGKRCPVRGAVSMDQIVVDVSHLPEVNVGETAVLIGNEGSETISVEELARRAGTIPYEILVRIGRRVDRVYLN
jgi:alanine racemase